MTHPHPIDAKATRGPAAHQAQWGQGLGQEHRAAIERTLPAGAAVLDLGTGRGGALPWLRERGYRAAGLDVSGYPEWREPGRGVFCRGEAARLPFADHAFDCVLAFEVLEHCADPGAALREIRRVTRRHLILSVPDCDLDNALRPYNLVPAHWSDPTHRHFFVRDTIRAVVEDAGFRVVELGGCVKIKPNSYFWATLRAPGVLRRIGRFVCHRLRLSATYWSSILVVAETADGPAPPEPAD